jgi:hypothetical protein
MMLILISDEGKRTDYEVSEDDLICDSSLNHIIGVLLSNLKEE